MPKAPTPKGKAGDVKKAATTVKHSPAGKEQPKGILKGTKTTPVKTAAAEQAKKPATAKVRPCHLNPRACARAAHSLQRCSCLQLRGVTAASVCNCQRSGCLIQYVLAPQTVKERPRRHLRCQGQEVCPAGNDPCHSNPQVFSQCTHRSSGLPVSPVLGVSSG